MKKILKYAIPPDSDDFTIPMPHGAKILCVQVQHKTPMIWALVDSSLSPLQRRHFRVYDTGELFSEIAVDYVGTYQLDGGTTVRHLFSN